MAIEVCEYNHSDEMNTAANSMGNFYKKCLKGLFYEKVLEVGCSGGGVLRQIPARLKCGIDIDEEKLKLINNRGDYCVVGDAENGLPFKERIFDLVIATDLFEHLFRPEKCIIQIKNILKTDGFLLTHVPNEFRWKNLVKLLVNESFITKGWFEGSDEYNYPHIRFFSKNGFRTFLYEHGFKIIEDWTYLKGGMVSRLTKHQLFSAGPTYLCQIT